MHGALLAFVGRAGAAARCRSLGAAGLLLLLGSLPLAAEGEVALPRLLVEGSLATAATASPAAVRELVGRIDPAAFDADGFALELPDGAVLEVRRERLERRGAASASWFGRVAGGGEAVLAMRGGYVSGLLYTAAGPVQIVPAADGRHHVVELDPARFAECANGVQPLPAERDAPPTSLAADPFDEVEVMVVYTPQARAAAGGVLQVAAVAQNAVDLTNTAYANSQVTPRMALVHTAEVAHADTGNLSTDLNWLASDPTVAALRDHFGADMVSLLVNSGGGCGIGYVQRNPGPGFASSAFQVTVLGCAVGNLSFAHEFGHNMGCEHNPEDASVWPSGGSFAWSYGHWHNGNYRTVMSYSNPCASGCTRQPYFSNANVSFQGALTGVADLRENYRTINATAQYVSNFRQSVGVIFVDGFESGNTAAWD